MKILITGGAGYIGSELVRYLLNDHEVTVFDNLMYDKTSLLRYVNVKSFNFIKGDVRNDSELKKAVEEHDIIISLAALVGFPLCAKNPIDAELVNYKANENISKWVSKNQLVIYPCTNSGYGSTDGKSVCTEESPMNAISIYGKTKVEAEKVIQQLNNFVTFRLATVFGPSTRMRTDLLVNNLVLKALKDKNIVLYEHSYMRNYLHIQDACRAFKHVIDNWEKVKNNTYNVGNDNINSSKLQLCETIKNHIPIDIIKSDFHSDPDKRNYIVSSQKFYNTGFECKFDLDIGIDQLIKAYSLIDTPWYANY